MTLFSRVEAGRRWRAEPTQGQRHNRVFVSGHGEMVPNANHAYESYLAHPPFAEQVFSFLFGPTP